MKLTKLFICILFTTLLVSSLYAQDSCPVISIIGPPSVLEEGEEMIFTAEVKGARSSDELTFDWDVDKGRIIGSKSNSSFKVDTTGLSGQIITASLEVKTNSGICELSASETGIVAVKREAILLERMENPNCEYRQMIMDSFFIQLQNDPAATGYIFTFGSPRRVAGVENAMRANIKWRNFDSSRIVFVNGGGRSKTPTIEFWLVPAGAETPTPEPPVENEADFDKPTEVTEVKIDPKEPYIFSSEYYDGGACIGEDREIDLQGYAEYLKTNPKARGNIVITLMTKKDFREKEKEILDFLRSKGIAKKRLRTFYVNGFGGVELWILP